MTKNLRDAKKDRLLDNSSKLGVLILKIRWINYFINKLPVSFIFLGAFLLTVISASMVYRFRKTEQLSRLDYITKHIVGAIESRLGFYISTLIQTRSLFYASVKVERNEFYEFIKYLELDTRYPGSVGIGFVPRVPVGNLSKHLSSFRNDGLRNYNIWPAGQKSEYFPVVYIEPMSEENKMKIGYDMSIDPIRAIAMDKARDTGLPVATNQVELVAEGDSDHKTGFVIFVPIYRNKSNLKTIESRRKEHLGFIFSLVRVNDFFSQILKELPVEFRPISIEVFSDQEKNTPFFDSNNPSSIQHLDRFSSEKNQMELELPIIFTDKFWTLIVHHQDESSKYFLILAPLQILLFGNLFGFLISFMIVTIRRNNKELERDLDLRKLSEEEVRRAKNLAEEANQIKTRFLANMSHEIRTPLGVILGFADLAIDPEISSDDRENYILAIKRNSLQLSNIVGDILDISKIEAKKLVIENVRFSLRIFFDELVAMFDQNMGGKKIELKMSLDPELPAFIQSDPTRLKQILDNLMGNSIKFSLDNVKIVIDVRPAAPMVLAKEFKLKFTIQDTGIGITSEQQTHLFQPFTQADPSITRRFGGTGLGLVLSREIAVALGGNLELTESIQGVGSTFSFTISGGLFDGQFISPVTSNGKVLPSKKPSTQKFTGKKILLVEDSDDNRALIGLYLKAANLNYDMAENGAEGIKKANATDYDLILMDIQMPVLDGLSAMSELRKAGFSKPIIALTAHALTEERNRALAAGFDDYLTKPIYRNTLYLCLERFLSLEKAPLDGLEIQR